MATAVTAAIGTLLKLGDGATSETFTTIAEVRDIDGPTLSAEEIDVTNHSTTGNYAESIAGLLDAGTVSFDVNYLPANATHNATDGLLDEFENRRRSNYQLVLTDSANTTQAFNAFVQQFSMRFPVREQNQASVVLRIVGQPTLV